MASLKDFDLNFFFNDAVQEKYRAIVNDNALGLADKILSLLTINPGFMDGENTEEESYKKFKYDNSLKMIKKAINENAELEFFALSYNCKPHKKEITNGMVYPDASEIIILIHLNMIFKCINEIYKPGAKITIGNQIHYFHKFNEITEDESIEMVKIINDFNKYAQSRLGSYGKVEIYDVYEEVNKMKKEFYVRLENTKLEILQEDTEMVEIRKGADYYLNFVVDATRFPNAEAAWNFCLYHTLDSAAYKIAIMNMDDMQEGLFKNFSKKLQVETRFQKGSNLKENERSIFVSFLPGAETFSFNRLFALMPNKKWKQIQYEELKNYNYKEVYVREYEYPLFYLIKGEKNA